MSGQLDAIRIFKFHRSHLFLGGERELVILTALVSLILVVILQNLTAAIIGGAVWIMLMPVLRLMARADPVMSKVYVAYARHQRYYPAHSLKLAVMLKGK